MYHCTRRPWCGVLAKGLRAHEDRFRSVGTHRAPFECDPGASRLYSDGSRVHRRNWTYLPSYKGPDTWLRDDHQHRSKEVGTRCNSCNNITFKTSNELWMHLLSRTHRNHKLRCPFCRKSHPIATGLVYHVETGSCPYAAGLNRDTLYRYLRSKDPKGAFTKAIEEPVLEHIFQIDRSSYNEERNGWECFICHKLFGTSRGLQMHLNSPAHLTKLYHCPHPPCGGEFTTLAGFIMHLESEACGYTRFETVQENIRSILARSVDERQSKTGFEKLPPSKIAS